MWYLRTVVPEMAVETWLGKIVITILIDDSAILFGGVSVY
jgi:hypothetical protein